MGMDKALLALPDGRLLWQRQLQILQSLGPKELFVSGPSRPGFPAGIRFLSDDSPGQGPLGGLVSALKSNSSPFLLLLAIDLPAMASEFLAELLGGCRNGKGLVTRDRYFEPLAAVYPRISLETAERKLAGTDLSMQALIADLVAADWMEIRDLSCEEKTFFKNWNTPEDSNAV